VLGASQFFICRSFGLTSDTPMAWMKRVVNRPLVMAFFYIPYCLWLRFSLRSMGAAWWMNAWAALVLLFGIYAGVLPTMIMPRFFKVTPLTDSPVRSRIEELCRRLLFPIEDVQLLQFGRSLHLGYACIAGNGKHRRILVSDTLLTTLNEDEVEAVVAHEVGHAKHRDILKRLAVVAAGSFAGYFVIGLFCQIIIEDPISTMMPAGFLSLLVASLSCLTWSSLLMMPMARKQEFAADSFSASSVADPESLVTALTKIYQQNLQMTSKARKHTHPPLPQRIENIRKTVEQKTVAVSI
jgi:STE24 endopeptidase